MTSTEYLLKDLKNRLSQDRVRVDQLYNKILEILKQRKEIIAKWK